MSEHLAIRHSAFGKPLEVLNLEKVPILEPAAGEVRVRLLAASINPSDFGMIGGSYGSLRELPAVAGKEGVGVVEALGEGVTSLKIGDRVRFPEDGAWQALACSQAEGLIVVPEGVATDQAAISFINPPTAYCLLTKLIDLKPGDWLLQNAGNSSVGVAVIQMAKALGYRTISQVRREELVEPLMAMGADHVVLEGSDWTKRVGELTGGAPIRLALNSVGGSSAMDQIKVLGDGGSQVTFGAMVGDPVRFPTRYLIFNDVRMLGFWWDAWIRREGIDAVREVMAAVYGMMQSGALKLPIEASYALEDFQEAIQHAQSPRMGKVLLKTKD